MVNMSEEWRESIVEGRHIDDGKSDAQKTIDRNERAGGGNEENQRKFSNWNPNYNKSVFTLNRQSRHLQSRGVRRPVATSPSRPNKYGVTPSGKYELMQKKKRNPPSNIPYHD